MALKSAQPDGDKVDVEEVLDHIDKTLDRTKVLYEQYFLGMQKQPPTQLHTDVERRLRELQQLNIRNTGLRYRFATIQQKFGSYNSYWRRTVRQIENGTYIRNLAKISRNAAMTGEEVPEEILAAMPKRMREQVKRDREQALAAKRRREQDAYDLDMGDLDDAAVISNAPPKQTTPPPMKGGAHLLGDEGDFDIEAFFASVTDEKPSTSTDRDDKDEDTQPNAAAYGAPARPSQPLRTQPIARVAAAATLPSRAPRSIEDEPTGAHAPRAPQAVEDEPTGVVTPAPRALPGLPTRQQSVPGVTNLAASANPRGARAASAPASPREIADAHAATGAIPTIPGVDAHAETGAMPTIPDDARTTSAIPRAGAIRTPTSAIPRPATGAVPTLRPSTSALPTAEARTQAVPVVPPPRPGVPRPPSQPGTPPPIPRAASQPGTPQRTQAIAVPPPATGQRTPFPPPTPTSPQPASGQRTPFPPPAAQKTQAIAVPPPAQRAPVAAPPAETAAPQRTQAIPAVPPPGQRTPFPAVPAPGAARPVVPAPPRTALPTPPRTQAIPVVPMPAKPGASGAPSQQSRPIPVVPGSASGRQAIPVQSMQGPFERTPVAPKPKPEPAAKPEPGMRPPPGMNDADVNALYAKYVKAKEMVGEEAGPGAYGKLMKTINAQAPKIMEQYKAKGVEFSVVVKDNQVVIKAKPKT